MCSSTKKPLCDLCGKVIGIPGNLRGICADCDYQLAGGKYSAPIVQAERRSMRIGGLFANREPLPARMMEVIWGSRDERTLAAMQFKTSARPAITISYTPAVEPAAEPISPPAPPPAPARKPRQYHRKPTPQLAPSGDWREQAAELSRLAYV